MTTSPTNPQPKVASITIYLMEELTDARLRCDQLKRYVSQAVSLIDKSQHKDHFYEVAGQLLSGIPETLFKLDKALSATALAASRLDYDELKQQLKPEKSSELEDVMKDIRVRMVQRRSAPQTNTKEGTAMGKTPSEIIGNLRRIASRLESDHTPSRAQTVAELRTLLAEVDPTAGAGEDFQKENPKITDEEVKKIDEMHDKNKDVVKDKHATSDEIAGAGEDFQRKNPKITDEDVKKIDEMHDKHKNVVKDKHADAAGLDPEVPAPVATPLGGFEAAFDSARSTYMYARRGNDRQTAFFGMNTIAQMANAMSVLAPEHADVLSLIAAKATRLVAVVRSEAGRGDVLASAEVNIEPPRRPAR